MKHWTTFKTFLVELPKIIGELPKKSSHEYSIRPSASRFRLAHMGRPGLDPGTRELIEYPYIIVYEVHEDRGDIVVLSVVHGAQDRENKGV